ncbi:phage portal protein [Silvanigrella sp.]|jgi:lambda family phage portal protein|uniref:phage portal protein n=1 Tax=Silvanigrella sp. TaxID=2024976 RepID=UPI0037CC082A
MIQDNVYYQWEINTRSFAAASRSARHQNWLALDTHGINHKLAYNLSTLRARSRQLVDDSGYPSKAMSSIQNNVVGGGILADIYYGNKKNRFLQELWDEWAKSANVSADGMLNLYGLQSLACREVAAGGDAFLRWYPADNLLGFEIGLIEAELVDESLNQTTSPMGQIVQGVVVNPRGRRLGFMVKHSHNTAESSFIPATEMLQLIKIERAGQIRGIPTLTPAMLDLKHLDDYQTSELIRRRVASCFSAFVHDIQGGSQIAEKDNPRHLEGETMGAGTIEYLPAGKTVTFPTPPNVLGYAEFVSVTLKKIAAAISMPYELLTSDLSEVNFSSARVGLVEYYKNVDAWRENTIIPQMCDPIVKWFAEGVNYHYPKFEVEKIKAIWTAPKRESIDTLKDVKAHVLALQHQLKTVEEIRREDGYTSSEQVLNTPLKNKTDNKNKKIGGNK